MKKLKLGKYLIVMLLVIVACDPPPRHRNTQATVSKKIFVKGDPKNIIKGAELNTDLPFAQFLKANITSFTPLFQLDFEESEEQKKIENIKSGHEGSENTSVDVANESTSNLTLKEGSGEYSYILELKGQEIRFFKDDPKKIEVINDGKKVTSELVHVSFTEDLRYLSLLTFERTAKSKTLSAVYLMSSQLESKKMETDGTDYIYNAGKGIKYAWSKEKPVEIEFCNANQNHAQIANFDTAIEAWKKHLDGRLTVETKVSTKFKPFSDLNQHCVYIVENYLTVADDESTSTGATPSILDMNTGEILDSDVLVFENEFKKYEKWPDEDGKAYSKEKLAQYLDEKHLHVFIHELGHLFGLDHPFTKSNPDGVWSIMNYNSSDELTSYDIEAIQNLYPLK